MGLRGYSRLRKAKLITFLQNNLQQRTRPSAPPPSPPTWEPIDDRPRLAGRPTPQHPPSVRFRPDRPKQPELLKQLNERQASTHDMDIFEQQEMRKNRPQVKSKLNDWHDWLVNHVPKTIKDRASRAFKAFKEKS